MRHGNTLSMPRPEPDDLDHVRWTVTCNEIARLLITLIAQCVHDTAHRLAGPTGDAATRPDPEQATTSARLPP
ncbi:hypothetical protein GCM10010206_59960 [Streptomyces cinerochromogenes]|nr:hypothetical protein GCM10010206_59960 [Streptomyces cinerochromogenes]